MYFLVFLVILILVYINSFKDSFTPENIEKVAPILLVGVLILLLVVVLDCIL